ncbi:MAG TPA: hypothetical protein VNK24_10550 [Elusimicrobiota bacterium]|nr:hypothetical protein [Elusimicrobiota bacterium]
MKLSSLAAAVLALPLFVAAAHADSGDSVYYFQNGQRTVVTRQQAEAMTEPQIEAVCAKIDASMAAIKELDKNTKDDGALIRQYVKDNYDEIPRTLGWAYSVNDEHLPNIGSTPNLGEIAAETLAVEKHNVIARKGQAAIGRVQADMLKAAKAANICDLEDCDYSSYEG